MEKFKIYHDKLDALRAKFKEISDEINIQMDEIGTEYAKTAQSEFEKKHNIKFNDKIMYLGAPHFYKGVQAFKCCGWVELKLVLARIRKDGKESKAPLVKAYLNEYKMWNHNIKLISEQ